VLFQFGKAMPADVVHLFGHHCRAAGRRCAYGGRLAMWCVVGIGLFTSIGGRTFSLALDKMGVLKGQVSSLLVMAVVGGALLPPLRADCGYSHQKRNQTACNFRSSFDDRYAYVAFYADCHKIGEGTRGGLTRSDHLHGWLHLRFALLLMLLKVGKYDEKTFLALLSLGCWLSWPGAERHSPSSVFHYEGRVMCGYSSWFRRTRWLRRRLESLRNMARLPRRLGSDFWRTFRNTKRHRPLTNRDGTPSGFSVPWIKARRPAFQWMQEYGIDGVSCSVFWRPAHGRPPEKKPVVLEHAIKSRKIRPGNFGDVRPFRLRQGRDCSVIIRLKELVDELKITSRPRQLSLSRGNRWWLSGTGFSRPRLQHPRHRHRKAG